MLSPKAREAVIIGSSGAGIALVLLVIILISSQRKPDSTRYPSDTSPNKTPAYKDNYKNYSSPTPTKSINEQRFDRSSFYENKLIEYVKNGMHNPDSFNHVETKYFESGGRGVFVLKFRGTNAFGAVVTQKVCAITKVNSLDIESMGPFDE